MMSERSIRSPHQVLSNKDTYLNPDLVSDARTLLDAWDEWTRGVSPSVAAAAAYYAAGLEDDVLSVSQAAVAEYFGVSTVSVRNHYKDIQQAGDRSD